MKRITSTVTSWVKPIPTFLILSVCLFALLQAGNLALNLLLAIAHPQTLWIAALVEIALLASVGGKGLVWALGRLLPASGARPPKSTNPRR